MDEQRIEAHVVVTGRVQGVCFRDFTQRAALGEAVCGWVRNLPDRNVEALLQGNPVAVARVIQQMRVGPPAARVTDIRVDMRPAEVPHEKFEIRY
jgi:acylphosphatase